MESGRTQIMAHRGFSGKFPENTLLAFKEAIKLGVDSVELDVHHTKDGVIVVSHDKDLKRCAGKPGEITQLTYAEIQTYDLPQQQKVPTLKEVLECLTPSKLKINIEIKGEDTEQPTYDLVTQLHLQDRVCYCSFRLSALQKLREISPTATLALIYSRLPKGGLDHCFKEGKLVQAAFLNPEVHSLSTARIKKIHAQGFKINTWIIDSPKLLAKAQKLGIEEVTSNHPDRLLNDLKK